MRGGQESSPTPVWKGKGEKTIRFSHLRTALLAAVGLFVVVFYAEPAAANYPGKPGKIAYSGLDAPNGDYEIYTIDPNGEGKKQLTDNSLDDRYPAYSASGKKIVYSGLDAPNGDSEIYTINAGGGGKKQLTDNSLSDFEPSYSPSGKKIAFYVYDANDAINGDPE